MKKIEDRELAKAIYGAIAFFDIFSRPLDRKEIHKFLYKKRASLIEIDEELKRNKQLKHLIGEGLGYYYIKGHREIVEEFLERKEYSRKFWRENLRYIKLLRSVPFIKMIAIGGSFAREMVDEISDFDLCVVAKNHRIYLARAFINFINKRIKAARKLDKDLLQVAFVFSERHMKFLKAQSFLASEMLMLIWLYGTISPVDILDNNKWVADFFPNGYRTEVYQKDYPIMNMKQNIIARFFEWLFSHAIGNYLEDYFHDKTVNSMSNDFEDKYWARDGSIGLRKDHIKWVEPEEIVDKLIKQQF
jgi:predicted nucleotidyltransferase